MVRVTAEEYIEKQRKNHKKIDWHKLSEDFNLSEEFIEKNFDKFCWCSGISAHQKLSIKFIEKQFDNLDKDCIEKFQKLSEKFIEKHFDELDLYDICKYQKLSEKFIEKHYKLFKGYAFEFYQVLSKEFFIKHRISFPRLSWLYKSGDEKLKVIKDSGKYQVKGDYVYAYKGIRSDRYSNYNFQYKYDLGKTYTCHADHNPSNENSFGLSAWTLDGARDYCDELIVLVKIHKNDLAGLVHYSNKIRCSKFTVVADAERN